ncbi:MAG: CRISPR-associated endoribonuclease Cas6 [Calditrichaceae bacterium]|nr:CRISPR-associated endoribonuclease Cas6 [Calditrichaceae bacterium]MBN2707441.1 CRISPR-associated endoribonuclease Cas6 [Calditrichaceae bacterium]RQV94009.1 MAG: CRISPR-associated endoribonuclease Cas6 [Calditrichota bacterium]
MRIKVSFASQNIPIFIPINTNYYIANLINQLCYEYQNYLKSLMPDSAQKNTFNIYTFSQLIIPLRKIYKFKICVNSPEFYLYISSPFYQFLSILAKELRCRKTIKIFDYRFEINDISFYPSPDFKTSEARFTCLSPVTVYKDTGSSVEQNLPHAHNILQYMYPNEEDYQKYVKRDLIYKYNILNNENRQYLDMQLQFDSDYIKRKNNRITKVITLESQDAAPEQIRGVLAPLKVKAEPEILQIIYDAGLGQLNNLGFGMVEMVYPGKEIPAMI